MKLLGILRASGLCLLVTAFHGPRGVFCSNLKVDPSNESFTVEVSENHQESTVESSSQESLPVAKSGLVFESSEWDDSHLASTVLFLGEFCKEVKRDKFRDNYPGKSFKGISGACTRVSIRLEPIARKLLPSGVHENPYKDALEPEKFKDYVDWLKKNIPGIKTSIINIYDESMKLTKEKIKTDARTVLSKYGFEFVCDGWREVIYRLPSSNYGINILGELKGLSNSLNEF